VSNTTVIRPELRDFFAALRHREKLTIQDMVDRTGIKRHVLGPIVRGQVSTIAPEDARQIVQNLPITMEQFLTAAGYEMGLSPQRRLSPTLVDKLARLSPEQLDVIERTAQMLLQPRAPRGQQ
jgi:transcriptional regulator with XRE-family HTH domain